MRLARFLTLAAMIWMASFASQAANAAAPQSPTNELAPAITVPSTEAHTAAAAHADDHGGGGGGLPLYATPVFDFGFFKVTNSMLVSWVVALLLIIGARMAMRHAREVPSGAQNFWEWM